MFKEIQHGEVTLLLELNHLKYDIRGYFIKDEPEKLYVLDYVNHSLRQFVKNTTIELVPVDELIKNLIVEKSHLVLEKYFEDNINNQDIYYPKKNHWDGNRKDYQILRLLDTPESKFDISINAFFIEELEKGILKLRIGDLYFELDVQTKAFNIWHKQGVKGDDYNMLNFFSYIDSHLAYYQISKGTAHPAFVELFNLKQFLEDKKSVKVVIDGKEYTIKSKYGGLSTGGLLQVDEQGNITLNEYRVDGLNSDVDINNVESFKYGKNVFKFSKPIVLPSVVLC